jgi:hypothetical protein
MPCVRGRDFDAEDFGDDDDLIALERADALLDNRDPSQAEAVVAARRAAEQERRRREAQLEKIRIASEKRKRVFRRRLLVVVVAVVALGSAAVPASIALKREIERNNAARKGLDDERMSAVAAGFKDEKDFFDVPSAGVKVQVPRSTCSAVLAVAEGRPGKAAVRIERKQGEPVESPEGIAWCSCEPEEVLIRGGDPNAPRTSIRWISAPMGEVGGAEVLRVNPPHGFKVVSDGTGMACADSAFDLWSQHAGHGDIDPLAKDRKGLTEALVAEGMEAVGLLRAGRAFGVVRSAQGYCYLVIPDGPGSSLTLREQDGRRIAEEAAGAFGWCSSTGGEVYSIWPATPGGPPVLVLRAPANRIGGVTGVHEMALRRGAGAFRAHLSEDDLEPDVNAALVASTVNEATITRADAGGLPEKQGALVTAFALLRDGAYLPDAAPRVPYACFPPYEVKADAQAFTCWQAIPQRWRTEGKPKHQAAAQGPMPFWMAVLAGVGDPGAVEAGAKLLSFARRMTLMGFEPTTIEGVRDTASGAVVSGRAGLVDTVGVGITATRPWIHPLTDGDPWSLDGAVHIVRVPEGKTITLRATSPLGANAAARRVVVWRR